MDVDDDVLWSMDKDNASGTITDNGVAASCDDAFDKIGGRADVFASLSDNLYDIEVVAVFSYCSKSRDIRSVLLLVPAPLLLPPPPPPLPLPLLDACEY